MIKILQVAPSIRRSYGGPVYSVISFALAARSAGIHVTIIGPAADAKELAWLTGEVPGIAVQTFPAIGQDAFVVSVPLLAWLRKNRNRFDVIHVHGLLNPISSLAARFCALGRRPFVIHPFGTLSRYTFTHRRTALKKWYFRVLDGPNVKSAAAMHFTTSAERDESLWHGISWGERAHVIPRAWIGLPLGYRTERRRRAAPRVLLMARLHPVKNIEGLLQAWCLVRAAEPDARLIIAGEGKPGYVRRIKDLAATLCRDSGVEFVGFVTAEAKRDLLASADLFVLPSFHENFGVVVLEALAAGLPVVITPEVQLSSFVSELGLGVVVDRSPASLARGLLDAIHDDALHERCMSEAPRLVAEHFAPSVVGKRLLQMYSAAIARTTAE